MCGSCIQVQKIWKNITMQSSSLLSGLQPALEFMCGLLKCYRLGLKRINVPIDKSCGDNNDIKMQLMIINLLLN